MKADETKNDNNADVNWRHLAPDVAEPACVSLRVSSLDDISTATTRHYSN